MVTNNWNGNSKMVNSQSFSGTTVTQYFSPFSGTMLTGGQTFDYGLLTVKINTLICMGTAVSYAGAASATIDYAVQSNGYLTLYYLRDNTYSGVIDSIVPSVYSNQAVQITFGTWSNDIGYCVTWYECFMSHFGDF